MVVLGATIGQMGKLGGEFWYEIVLGKLHRANHRHGLGERPPLA
jgi:hypothetical protein